MIHYTCDHCQRRLDPKHDLRYVVQIEVYASMNPLDDDVDDDADHLQEIQDILEQMDDAENDRIGDDVYQKVRYDLCADCRKLFLLKPFGQPASKKFNFSQN